LLLFHLLYLSLFSWQHQQNSRTSFLPQSNHGNMVMINRWIWTHSKLWLETVVRWESKHKVPREKYPHIHLQFLCSLESSSTETSSFVHYNYFALLLDREKQQQASNV
jgi:hypothetical protein